MTNHALVFEKIVNLLNVILSKTLQLPESTRMTSIEFTRARILSTAFIQLDLEDIIQLDELDRLAENISLVIYILLLNIISF
jgi:hypothetical protein